VLGGEMILTKKEMLESFMKDIETFKAQVDAETFKCTMESFAASMMGMPIPKLTDKEQPSKEKK
jgi:hypothetical protein